MEADTLINKVPILTDGVQPVHFNIIYEVVLIPSVSFTPFMTTPFVSTLSCYTMYVPKRDSFVHYAFDFRITYPTSLVS